MSTILLLAPTSLCLKHYNSILNVCLLSPSTRVKHASSVLTISTLKNVLWFPTSTAQRWNFSAQPKVYPYLVIACATFSGFPPAKSLYFHRNSLFEFYVNISIFPMCREKTKGGWAPNYRNTSTSKAPFFNLSCPFLPQRAVLHPSGAMLCSREHHLLQKQSFISLSLSASFHVQPCCQVPPGLLDFHVCVFPCFCVISAGINEPQILKCNLFRSLPLGWELRCCHQPENLWSNLEAVSRTVFSQTLQKAALSPHFSTVS